MNSRILLKIYNNINLIYTKQILTVNFLLLTIFLQRHIRFSLPILYTNKYKYKMK